MTQQPEKNREVPPDELAKANELMQALSNAIPSANIELDPVLDFIRPPQIVEKQEAFKGQDKSRWIPQSSSTTPPRKDKSSKKIDLSDDSLVKLLESWKIQKKRKTSTLTLSSIINNAQEQLIQQQKERLTQAHLAFIVALSSLILGILLIIIGVLCLFFVNLPTGTVTSASSIIINAISGLSFWLHKDTNDRYDKASLELRNIALAEAATDFIPYISDPQKKDQAISDFIQQLRASSLSGNTTPN